MVYYNGIPIIEGIDKITVTLSQFMNLDFKKQNIDPKKRLTVRGNHNPYKFRAYLDIHAEFINPLLPIKLNIAKAIYHAIQAGFIEPCFSVDDISDIYSGLTGFIDNIHTIEFFFDLSEGSFTVLNPMNLVFIGKKDPTIYSNDFRKKNGVRVSLLKLYNRAAHLKLQNNISHKLIDAYPLKWRLEFVLTRYNCKYITLKDISGNYMTIMNKYYKLLSAIYARYFKDNIQLTVLPIFHPYLYKILTEADNGKTRYRGDLEKIYTKHTPEYLYSNICQYNTIDSIRERELLDKMCLL